MVSSNDLVEQWFAQTLESYPQLTARFLATEKDPFRNPVGHALRDGMMVLVQELLGGMDREQVTRALDEIMHIRVVQDFTPSQAVGFVFLVRAILLGTNPPRPAMVGARVDQLALMAFDQYMKCREHIAQVRVNEAGRNMRARPLLQRK
jgi:RsbT co-antagonist protein rsbRD N-terminal domain